MLLDPESGDCFTISLCIILGERLQQDIWFPAWTSREGRYPVSSLLLTFHSIQLRILVINQTVISIPTHKNHRAKTIELSSSNICWTLSNNAGPDFCLSAVYSQNNDTFCSLILIYQWGITWNLPKPVSLHPINV